MDGFSLGLGNRGERVMGELVTGNYFSVLGVRTSLGRPLQASDDVSPGRHPVVVISDGLWKRAFASDPAIVGRTIQVNAHPMTVVGVAEPDFHGSVVSIAIDPVYFLIVPVTPSGEQLNGSIFSADGAYSFLDRGNGCLKNSGSVRSISTTRR